MNKITLRGIYFLCLFSISLHAQEENIQLYVLGNAQDAGAPQLGCERSCCAKGSETHAVSSLAVVDENDGAAVIFDASPHLPKQLRQLRDWTGMNDLWPDAVFITHAHMGHYSGLLHFGREAANSKDLPVYTLPRMRRFLENNAPWEQLVTLENINLQTLQPAEAKNPIPKIQVIPLLVPHRDEYSETAAFLIQGPNKTALYLPDIDKWQRWEMSLEDLLKEVDYAFLDATFYSEDELPGRDLAEIPHPTVRESMDLLDTLPGSEHSKVYFIHMNHTNPLLLENSPETKAVLEKGYNIARTGTKFGL